MPTIETPSHKRSCVHFLENAIRALETEGQAAVTSGKALGLISIALAHLALAQNPGAEKQ